MAFLEKLLQPLPCYVSVDLSRRNIGVAQHDLNRSQVSARLQEMTGKRMPQTVRRYLFLDTCRQPILLYDFPEPLSGHGATP